MILQQTLSVAADIHVLLVEDDEDDALLILTHLGDHGFRVTADRVENLAAMRGHLASGTYDVIICDYYMPSFTATHALQCVRDMTADTPVVVVSGRIEDEIAVSLVKQGASDFLSKDRLARAGIAVEAVIHQRELASANLLAEEEQKKIAERLRQAEKMEAIGRLAGGVAHDFNNVLSVILNYADFALEGFADGTLEESDIREIRAAAERGASLTRQLLAFSRKELIKPQVLELSTIIDGFTEFLTRTVGEDVSLDVDVCESVWPIEVDRGHVEQVLMNLAGNARDAMPAGGTLRIGAQNHVLRIPPAGTKRSPTGHYVVISVSDSGSGISAEVKERLFEPFFTTKAKGSGTGLGLATVLAIVEQWGGHMEVDSEQGVGTTFRITLPAADALYADETRSGTQETSSGRSTILVVEDEAPLCAVIERVLISRGYEVVMAGSGEEALAFYEAADGDFDLVLTDVVMPGMSGRELADAIRSSGHAPKLVFMSGYLGDVLLREGIATDGVDYLPKPFDTSTLLATIEGLLAA